MPTRTEVIISIGEVLECLPPGKPYRRKRYNSFDANQALEAENEENVAPPGGIDVRCDLASAGMKSRENGVLDTEGDPQVLTIRRKTRGSEDGSRNSSTDLPAEEDDEVTFNPETVNVIVENGTSANGEENSAGKTKAKRKSSAEKFLEDNASYFQLEVLASKTRSSKNFDTHGGAAENGEDEKVEGFHNSFLDFLKSKGVEGKGEDGEESRSRARHKSGPISGASRKSRQRKSSCQSPARSDSEDSFKPPRSRSQIGKSRTRVRLRSRSREFSPSESETEFRDKTPTRNRLRKKDPATVSKLLESSDDESEGSYTKSTRSRSHQDSISSPSPGKRARRSELDKLLEAVDTSFHFETAAAAAKRLGGPSDLGPLEIDVSDSNLDESGQEEDLEEENQKKRKLSQTAPESKRKKLKRKKGDLLKTISPDTSKKTDAESDMEVEEPVWDGWDKLHQTLANNDALPVAVEDLHFSFEVTPFREPWFNTYSRQDNGDDLVYYPDGKGFPFLLPYELPYSTFMPDKLDKTDVKVEENKKTTKGKDGNLKTEGGKRKKVSESESIDSDSCKKGKTKLGPKIDHLQDLQPRVSPRCHASTKAILHGGVPLTDEELAEALLIQDERDVHQNSYASFLNLDDASNDSSSSAKNFRRENHTDLAQIATSMDRYLRNTECLTEVDLAAECSPVKSSAKDKVTVPTRSRISSEELLKNLKDKPKKKKEKVCSAEAIMDQVVADHVDGLLLDCLEEELPTIPFDSAEPLTLLESYQSCNSMNVCNSRWLRPSRPSLHNSDSSSKKPSLPFKPKRLVIYKEDLPGFKYDNDMEMEKLPVSKRCLAKSGKNEGTVEKEVKNVSAPATPKEKNKPKLLKKKKKELVKKEKVNKEPKATKNDSDDDVRSVSSSVSETSRKKIKKKQNKTGFPAVKKKKAPVIKPDSATPEKKNAAEPKAGVKSPKSVKKSRQLKMDKFITKKSGKKSISPKPSTSRHAASDLGRRSAATSKNYSEIESDTESLFESKIPYRSPHMRMFKKSSPQKPKLKK